MSELLPPACVESDRLLVDAAYGETVPEAIQAHIAGCARCSAALADLRKTRADMASLPAEEPSPALEADVMAAVDAHLRGESVDKFLLLPNPEIALGAKRLLQHISRPPISMVPRPVLMPEQIERTVPEMPRAYQRARRRWPAAMGIAASIALVGGGALYLTMGNDAESPLQRVASQEVSAPKAPPPSAAAVPTDLKKDVAADKPAAGPAPDLDRSASVHTRFVEKALSGEKKGKAQEQYAQPAERTVERVEKMKKSSRLANTGMLNGLGSASASGGFAQDQVAAAPRAFAPPPPVATPAPAVPVMIPAKEVAQAQAAPRDDADEVAEYKSAPRRKMEAAAASEEAEGAVPEQKPEAMPRWALSVQEARAKNTPEAWAKVLAIPGLPSNIQEEALLARVRGLIARSRYDEAQATADELARRFPAHADARNEVRRARPDSPAAAAKAAAPMAPPAAEAPATTTAAPGQ